MVLLDSNSIADAMVCACRKLLPDFFGVKPLIGAYSLALALGYVAGQIELFSAETQLPRLGTPISVPPSVEGYAMKTSMQSTNKPRPPQSPAAWMSVT